jgi:Right handed beta helix region
MRCLPASSLLTALAAAQGPEPAAVVVHNRSELQAAVAAARPGTRIEVVAGDYAGGLSFAGLHGAAGRPIVIAAADPAHPPQFRGGSNGMHFIDARHVELRDLRFADATGNGLNLDDGGVPDPTPRAIALRRLVVADIGPRGNHDGIKLSGLTGVLVEDCTIERWGIGSGCGIDMVGCHDVVLQRNTLRHAADAAATGGSGVQCKGGSRGIVIRDNRFEHAGARGVNLGGSTGLVWFRPPLANWPGPERYEAAELLVEGNLFVGSAAPIAFVGVDGATVRHNTIVEPGRWALRILQETRTEGFVPCRRGSFTDNLVVFRAANWHGGGVNVGDGTAPETFTFARNWWWCADRPTQSEPRLPVREVDGIYGRDPELGEDWRPSPRSAARAKGRPAATPARR